MPTKRFSPERRQSGTRDPKLIIIATEGECTEPQYFDELRICKGRANIHVEVLPTQNTRSSPEYVLARLDEFRTQYPLKRNRDELWMVIDFDRWGEQKLSDIARLCEQKGYHLAVSNPCFEIWLLFHFVNLQRYSDEERENLRENRRDNGLRTPVEIELVNACGEYQKSKLKFDLFAPNIERAIKEARSNDIAGERWPQNLGTHIYKLVEKMIKLPYMN